jgi:hypothetical protein
MEYVVKMSKLGLGMEQKDGLGVAYRGERYRRGRRDDRRSCSARIDCVAVNAFR